MKRIIRIIETPQPLFTVPPKVLPPKIAPKIINVASIAIIVTIYLKFIGCHVSFDKFVHQ